MGEMLKKNDIEMTVIEDVKKSAKLHLSHITSFFEGSCDTVQASKTELCSTAVFLQAHTSIIV